MGIFDPDDFEGQPYVGGLNQLGHVVFGAGLAGIAATFAGITLAILISGGGVIIWEAYQLKRRRALKPDYIADLFYWIMGIGLWAALIAGGYISGIGKLWPLVPLAAWVLEYARLSWRELFK